MFLDESEGSWYFRELGDLVRKGSKAALVSSKIGDLKELLGRKADWTWGDFRQATELMGEVKDNVRSQMVSATLEGFADA